ncbi:MAG: protein kinase domain-containing protein [Planctomycetota bacterium]|jgi:serine/threonine protein kinase
MTAPTGALDACSNSCDDELLATCFDGFVEDVLDGRETDLAAVLSDRPDLQGRIEAMYALACRVAGRRSPQLPRFQGYTILRELGRGGMGTVYLARQEDLGRDVALKVLPPAAGLSGRATFRFMEEARALARLRDPHIVQIYQILEHEGTLAYTMEWVSGMSLRQLLEQMRPKARRASLADMARELGDPDASFGATSLVQYFVRVGIRIARALAKVHRAGLVHRDVKPSNILIRSDGTPLLSDFGLVRGSSSPMTHTGAFVGTPVYAPPEQLRGSRQALDARADVYALGITLYEAIAFAPPFEGASTVQVLRGIEEGQVRRLRSVAPDVPRDLETILHKAIEPNPHDRYQTADELADDLERLLKLVPIHARPPGILKRGFKFVRRHRRSFTAAALGAVIVAGVMTPFVARAGRRADVEKRVAQLTREAWVALLSPEARQQVWIQAILGHRSESSHQPSLTAALTAYDQALALDPENQELLLERSVVAVVHSLRAETKATTAPRTLLKTLPPVTAKTASKMLRGSRRAVTRRKDIAGASAPDLKALGLLAFLTGDFLSCERAWEKLDPMTTGFSLVNAGLGILYHADGRPERAYPRLFNVVHSDPQASFLSVELADIALCMGDVELAERWLSRAEEREAGRYNYRRVRADLWRAKGETERATSEYLNLIREAPELLTPYHGLTEIDLAAGQTSRAEERLRMVVRRWPQVARSRLALARIALQAGHLLTYLDQARHVVGVNYGYTRSPGIQRDLLEILRIGGLSRLYQHGLRITGRRPSTEQGGVPAALLWSERFGSVRLVEASIRRLAKFDRIGGRFRLPPAGSAVRSPATAWSHLSRTALHLPGLLRACDPRLRLGLQAGACWTRFHWPLVREWILPELLGFGKGCASPGPGWVCKHPETSPPAHSDLVLVATHSGTVLFGGSGPDGILYDDTWQWDGITWTRIETPVRPAKRLRHAGAYDRVRHRLVVFGGSTTSISGFMDDTWEFDGGSWTKMSPATRPKARNDHAMTYDPVRKRVILFGGRDADGLLNDLWEWNGRSWQQLRPETLMSPRRDHCLAYDTKRRRLITYGGYDERGHAEGNVWEWDGVYWHRMDSVVPGPRRAGAAAVYDERRAKLLEFSGYMGTVDSTTWAWDGDCWSQLELGAGPAGRSGHAMTYDFQRQRVVLFGGWARAFLADTWEF